MTNRQNIHYKKLRKQLAKAYGGKCEHPDCEETQNLQFAHRRPTGLSGKSRGRKEIVQDILNHPLDYALSCNTHNDYFDETIGYDDYLKEEHKNRQGPVRNSSTWHTKIVTTNIEMIQ